MPTTATQLPLWVEWARALGFPAVAIVLSILSGLVVYWQARLSKEKLRHDLYDRRFAIYIAFHDLLVAAAEADNIEDKLRMANTARAHGPFLLDKRLEKFLEELYREAFRINAIANLIRDKTLETPADRAVQSSQLGTDKLIFMGRVGELVKEFERFLRLKHSTG